jgi:hypothetical protein
MALHQGFKMILYAMVIMQILRMVGAGIRLRAMEEK